jgi:dTMP kinase
MNKNLFIALEGIDGSGKSTQMKLLTKKLEEAGHKVYTTFEPSNGAIGTMIRTILKGDTHTDDRIIAGLFVADRLDHLLNKENGILKKMDEGYTVICDRYCFSSYAYQGTHMSMDWVIAANAMSASILKPDVNVFIDIDPEVSMQRITTNRDKIEIYETLENQKKVKEKFFEAFDRMKDQENIFIVEGNRKPELIADDIFEELHTIANK